MQTAEGGPSCVRNRATVEPQVIRPQSLCSLIQHENSPWVRRGGLNITHFFLLVIIILVGFMDSGSGVRYEIETAAINLGYARMGSAG